MTFPITKTDQHTISVGDLVSTPVGGEQLFPTYLVTSDGTAISAANALHVQPGTGATWTVTDGGGSITVDGTVAVSGSVAVTGTFWQATQPVSIASVPSHDVTNAGTFAVQVSSSSLPTGAATSTKQDTIIASLSSIDGHVDGVEGSLSSIDAKITVCNTGAVVIASSALPTGAATAARQDTGNASLTSIDGKLPALGQALAAASVPVVLTAAQLSTLTPLSTVAATQSGTWTVGLSAGTNAIGKLAANSGVTIGAVEIAASQTLATVTTVSTVTTCSTLTTLTGGGVAHDGADSGNPVKVGGKASSAQSTATMVSSGDRTDLTSDLDGSVLVRDQFPLGDLLSERVTDTGGTSTAFSNFGATASTRNYVTAITVFNSSATAGYVDFRDGTGGSVLYTVPLPAGGGAVLCSNLPLFRTSANTALAYDVSGALSTVYISISGFKSKV